MSRDSGWRHTSVYARTMRLHFTIVSVTLIFCACQRDGECPLGSGVAERPDVQTASAVTGANQVCKHEEAAMRKEELVRALAEVASACSNREVAAIRSWTKRLPDKVVDLQELDFQEACRSLYGTVREVMAEFMCAEKLLELKSGDELELQLEYDFSVVRLWGACCVRRKSYGAGFDRIEAEVYRGLKDLQRICHDLGRAEDAEVIGKFVAELTRQIESSQGLTRAVATANVEHHKVWGARIMEECSISWDDVLERAVGIPAKPLIDAGYTPLWVRELKSTPRPATVRRPLE